MFGLTFLLVFLGCVSPVWADVAIAPVSLYLTGWILLWPMLIGVILIESGLLWQFWGKRAGYGPIKVVGQVTWVNIVSTLAGGVFLFFGDLFALNDAYWPLFIYFLLTLGIEAAILNFNYAPENSAQKIGPNEVWKASLTLNLSSYALILLALVVIPKSDYESQIGSRPTSIKSKMHSLQTLVETYGVDWGGEYPADLKALEAEAKTAKNPYWQEILDPDNKSALLLPGEPLRPFGLEYQPIFQAKTGKVLSYWIYGYDKTGKRLMQNGQFFALTNS
jgi:hypothetical protein